MCHSVMPCLEMWGHQHGSQAAERGHPAQPLCPVTSLLPGQGGFISAGSQGFEDKSYADHRALRPGDAFQGCEVLGMGFARGNPFPTPATNCRASWKKMHRVSKGCSPVGLIRDRKRLSPSTSTLAPTFN